MKSPSHLHIFSKREVIKQMAILPFFLNPIALRKAKIVYNFGLSECNRVIKQGEF